MNPLAVVVIGVALGGARYELAFSLVILSGEGEVPNLAAPHT